MFMKYYCLYFCVCKQIINIIARNVQVGSTANLKFYRYTFYLCNKNRLWHHTNISFIYIGSLYVSE